MTGVNILVDEVSVPPDQWSRAPRQVSVALTNSCDLACSYCYAPKHYAVLDVDRLLRWLTELDLDGCLGVGFGGGEPMLYRHFAEVCQRAAVETRLAVTFTTHAHRLTERLCGELLGSVHFIRVSMDGVGATYERLRGRSFGALLRRLELVRNLAPFGLNYVVNKNTLPDLLAACDLAEQVGAAELLLLPEQSVAGTGGIDNITRQQLVRIVERYRGNVPLVVSTGGADGLPTCDPLAAEEPLQAYVHIDAVGILKRSSYDLHGVLIDDNGVMKALDQLRAHRMGVS